jgi:hypothetical protein
MTAVYMSILWHPQVTQRTLHGPDCRSRSLRRHYNFTHRTGDRAGSLEDKVRRKSMMAPYEVQRNQAGAYVSFSQLHDV